MSNSRRLVTWGVLCTMLAAGWLGAQTQTGTVTGTAADTTGAMVPGARVILHNTETGVSRETTTNERGIFQFEQVKPGIYSVRISRDGFRTSTVEGIDVRASKSADLGQVKLEVGALTETVQVEATTTPLVETQSAQLTSSLNAKQTTALRAGFGVGIDSLAILTPGVVPGFGNINSNGMQVSANGQRSRSTQYLLDGHQMNDITIGGPSFFVRNLDQVAEYQVVTNQFSAEYGRNLGATVSIITKGGSNEHHGDLNWQHSNRALNSKTARQDRSNLPKPQLINNLWGVTVGGPILRDRLFYLGSYSGRKQPGAVSSIGTFASNKVLTANGLSALTARYPNSIPLQIYKSNGFFARPDGGPSCVAGTTQTLTVAGVPGVEACAGTRTVPSQTREWEYSGRLDYVTERHTFFGRYTIQDTSFCCNGGLEGYFINVPNRNQSTSYTHNWQVTSRINNQFRFNYGKFLVAFEGGNTSPIANVRENLANFALGSGWVGMGLATNLPQNRLLNSFQYQNNLSWQLGRHTLKFGVDLQKNYTSLFFLPFINGQFVFTSTSLQDFVDNTPSQVSFTAGAATFEPREFDQFYFFQDDIRLRPNLTINLGLRYEHNGQPINKAVDEILKREGDPAQALWLQSVPIAGRSLPRIRNDNNNWAPRVGFAWTPKTAKWLFGDGKTTIRGGYGIAYELAFYNILLNMTTAAPRVFAFSLPTAGIGVIPVPAGAKGSDVASRIPVPRNAFDPRTLFQTQLPVDFHNPYGQNWTLGVQRQISNNQVAEVRYVASNGIGLFQSRNANPLLSNLAGPTTIGGITLPGYPQYLDGKQPCTTAGATGLGRLDCNYAAIRERINAARSNYNSLQIRYDIRNFFNQFTGGFAYTWARGIDNSSEIFNFTGSGSFAFAQNPLDLIKGERGQSNFNLPQTLSFHYIWESPWFRSQQGFAGKVLGGWGVNGLAYLLAGRPWTPIQRTGNRYCGQDSQFNNSFAGLPSVCRPFSSNPNAPVNTVGFYTSDGVLHLGSATGAVVDKSAVRFIYNDDNGVRFFGNAPFGVGRNNFRGDPEYQFDIAINKVTNISERLKLRYQMAMVNAFNHRNFGVPNVRADLGDFGIASRNDAGGRTIRMALWLSF